MRVEPLPEPRPGAFDYGRYLRRRGEHVLLEGDFADLVVTGRRGGLQGVVDRLRLASRAHLAAGVHSPVADVLQGMVLGDDEGVDEALVEDFRASGLLHIMAVSGENVVLLCTMWSFAFALLGMHRLLRTALLLPVVATYVLLTGASPSIVRAGVAGICGLLAILASRPSDGWLLWLAPAAWLLTANPNNLFDVSFQLSFGAVVGLLVLARPLTRAVSFLPGPLPEQVGVTTAASISTAPVSVLTFGSASLVSVPANVAGGFVLGPIMFLGMLSLLLGFVSEWLSAPLNVVAGLFIGFLLAVSHFFAGLPGAVYEYQGVSLRLLLVVGLLAEIAVVGALAARAGEGVLAYVRDRRRWAPLAGATAALLAAALLLAPAPVRPPDVPTLTFLDVGEGAATLLQVPGGPTVLVDAGPEPLARALREHAVGGGRPARALPRTRRPRRRPRGRHRRRDDPGGAAAAAGGAVGRSRRHWRTACAPRARTCAGARRTCGWAEPGGASTSCRAPRRAASTRTRGRTTTRWWRWWGWPASACCSRATRRGRCSRTWTCPPASWSACRITGATAGSTPGSSGSSRLASAVVPVGPNRHGHPDPDALAVLTAAGVPYARTDERGDIALSAGSGGLSVTAERGG